MTLSIAGHCTRTGMFGVAITTSSICVGARCPHARAGVGAAATQNVTDPTLGPKVLDAIAGGMSARAAVASALTRRMAKGRRIFLACMSAPGREVGFRIWRPKVAAEGEMFTDAEGMQPNATPQAMTEARARGARRRGTPARRTRRNSRSHWGPIPWPMTPSQPRAASSWR